MNKEYEEYRPFIDKIEDVSLKRRADLSFKYYIKQANFYKLLWNVFSILGVVLPATATFLASIDCPDNSNCLEGLVVFVSACATISAGLLSFLKCNDKKTAYRKSAENLKSELCAYSTHNTPYGSDTNHNNELLFERLEEIIKEGYEKIKALEKKSQNDPES